MLLICDIYVQYAYITIVIIIIIIIITITIKTHIKINIKLQIKNAINCVLINKSSMMKFPQTLNFKISHLLKQ